MIRVPCPQLNVFNRHPAGKQVGREGSPQIVVRGCFDALASSIAFDDDSCFLSSGTQHPAKTIAGLVPSLVSASTANPFQRLIKRGEPLGCWLFKRNRLNLPGLLRLSKMNVLEVARDPMTTGSRLKTEHMAIVEPQAHQPRCHSRSRKAGRIFAGLASLRNAHQQSLNFLRCQTATLRFRLLSTIYLSRSLSRSIHNRKQILVGAPTQNSPHRRESGIDGGRRQVGLLQRFFKEPHVLLGQFAAFKVAKQIIELPERLLRFLNRPRRHALKVVAQGLAETRPHFIASSAVQLLLKIHPSLFNFVAVLFAAIKLLMSFAMQRPPAKRYSITPSLNCLDFNLHKSHCGLSAIHLLIASTEKTNRRLTCLHMPLFCLQKATNDLRFVYPKNSIARCSGMIPCCTSG